MRWISSVLAVGLALSVVGAVAQPALAAPATAAVSISCDGAACSGSYSAPVQVALTASGGAGTPTILFTTDGSVPTQQNGAVYSAPLTLSVTTTLSYVAYHGSNAGAAGTTTISIASAAPPAAADSGESPPQAPAAVTVSLTFDDGTADHMQAASMMAAYGMRGTFYVNSGRLGQPDRLTLDDVKELAADGHEIGGHTVSHANLPTLSTDEAIRQICMDRNNLLAQGLDVTDFAFPFGSTDDEVSRIAEQCGYNSARVVGGVVSPGACIGCPEAESLPPHHLYDMRTPDSIKQETTLAQMQGYVTQAQQDGGWVILVMHRICEDSCTQYSVSPGQLDAFLAWLASSEAAGDVAVKTVRQVIGGPVRDAVLASALSAPSSTNGTVSNSSLETLVPATGLPPCWQRGATGSNDAAVSVTGTAHDGATAGLVTITDYTSGDGRILTTQDLGQCAPSVAAGHTYQVSAWYQTDGTARPVAYTRNAAGGWSFFAQGPLLTPADSYVRVDWVTPPVPAGASGIAIGFSLRSIGSLVVDSVSLADTDQIAPTVSLVSPAPGSTISGITTLTATAQDSSGIANVSFAVDGEVICVDTEAPYGCQYDSTGRPNGYAAVRVVATDGALNIGESSTTDYIVFNGAPNNGNKPKVALTSPTPNAVLNGDATLSVDASGKDPISAVFFYADGAQIGIARTAPFQATWDTTQIPDGAVTLSATTWS